MTFNALGSEAWVCASSMVAYNKTQTIELNMTFNALGSEAWVCASSMVAYNTKHKQ